jgi:hypothetical protein
MAEQLPSLRNPPRFFLAIYLVCKDSVGCFSLDAATGKAILKSTTNAGFVEVIDVPCASDATSVTEFPSFITKVLRASPISEVIDGLGDSCASGGDCKGTYITFSGHDCKPHSLELDLRGHQDDSQKTGITSVDGTSIRDLDKWDLAGTDDELNLPHPNDPIISAKADGVITINNPRLAALNNSGRTCQLILDFSGATPRRTPPDEACTRPTPPPPPH